MDGQSGGALAIPEVVIDSASGNGHHFEHLHFPHECTTNTVVQSNHNKDTGRWSNLLLAYKTLGVVFGGLVTSPLYVFPSMHLNSPTEEDYLGIYSIMFWTLTLTGVVKYACIALKADDQGEGGTFALYSLLCRNMNIGILSSKHSDINSNRSCPVPHEDNKGKSRLGKVFERSIVARRVLLFMAMLGTCMPIADGILTPAISVLSAMDGLRAPFPSVKKSLVEALSAVVLFALFLLQKYGTSRVSFMFSPIIGAWTLCTPLVGIYSIIHHYPSIFKALSPHYIIHFFWRNGKEGWLMLGGTILCITGGVASLAMLITTILLTLVMIIIWRTPPLLAALYFVIFFTMEGVYVSAEAGWIPFAISFILAFIMFGWCYGRQRKIEYELTHKVDLERLGMLLSNPSVQRVPGLCFFYTNIQNGLTPILEHYIKNIRSLHTVTIFTTLRCSLVPKVAPQERIVVKKLGLKGVYACVIQYGYADSSNLGDDFVSQVIDSLQLHIENCSCCLPSDPSQVQEEISELREAKMAGVIHVRGKASFHIGKNTSLFDRFMLAFYEVLHNNCRSALTALGVPLPQRLEVGMFYEA